MQNILEETGAALDSAVVSFHVKIRSIPASGEAKEEEFEHKV